MSDAAPTPHLPQRGHAGRRSRPGGRGRGEGGSGRGNAQTPAPPRGGGGGRGVRRQTFPGVTDDLAPDPLLTLTIPTLDGDEEKVGIRNFEHLGHARVLTPEQRELPFQLEPDRGYQFVDQNRYRMGGQTLIPLLVSVDECRRLKGSGPFRWADMDFVTDRNNLRNLLRFVNRSTKKDFRIDLQLAGTKTVLCTRWTERTRVREQGNTYGFNFEKAVTTVFPGCEAGTQSTSHHRIVSYDFNGLRLAVRFEVDACRPRAPTQREVDQTTNESEQAANSSSQAVETDNRSTDDVDLLTRSLASTSLNPDNPHSQRSDLFVQLGGAEIHPDDLVELTTRASGTFSWNEEYPQLWLSQTTTHWLAKHSHGLFTKIDERLFEFGAPVREEQQAQFQKLRKLLDIIQSIVVEHGTEGRLSLVYRKGQLTVYKRTDQSSCLPSDLLATIV